MLKTLGWPSEKERRGGADARFLDLLGSATSHVTVSTVSLDGEALVMRSLQLDEIGRAGLQLLRRPAILLPARPAPPALPAWGREWGAMRSERPAASEPQFHGSIGPVASRRWSVSALETYLGCPFKFFAQYILGLREEPDDEEVMDPRRQGKFVHAVVEEILQEG